MNAFEIKDLECAYGDGETVLRVPNLDIPFGKLHVFLGPSGVGKSTLLETLGLMNHTIKKGQIHFHNDQTDFLELWESMPITIPDIRSEHMSFIFQENNLLDNLSALENAMIPLLIQGSSEDEAMKIVKDWCDELDLGFINIETAVSELSVGQKQRLAFIRAVSAKSTVLFGDEPTGNLDEKNGDVLMEALCRKIKESENSMVSIIVSHDIDLALKFADEIIVLTKETERCGVIGTGNIFKKEGDDEWQSTSANLDLNSLRNHISSLL